MSINLSQHSTWLAVLGSAALALGTQACGGGGGGNSSSNPSATVVTTGTGVFLDAPVAGIDYLGNLGSLGKTNANGEFQYRIGETVEFYLGGQDGLKLGRALIGSVGTTATDGKYYVTPLDLVQQEENASATPKTVDLTDTRVKNMAYLLQALNAGTGATLDLSGIDAAKVKQYKLLVNFASTVPFDGDTPLQSFFLDNVHKDKGSRTTTALTVANAVTTMDANIKKRFDGSYSGTWSNAGANKSGTWQFTIANGALSSGQYAGSSSGTFTGTLSPTGVITLTGGTDSLITAGDNDLLRINHDGSVGCKVCTTTRMNGERAMDLVGTWKMKVSNEAFGTLKNITANECGMLGQEVTVVITKNGSGVHAIQFAGNNLPSQGTLTTTSRGFSFNLTGATADRQWPFTWSGSVNCLNDFTCLGEGRYTLDTTVAGTPYFCGTVQNDLYQRN